MHPKLKQLEAERTLLSQLVSTHSRTRTRMATAGMVLRLLQIEAELSDLQSVNLTWVG